MQIFQFSNRLIKLAGLGCGLVICIVSCSSAPSTSVSQAAPTVAPDNLGIKQPELLVERLSWGINTSSAMQIHQVGAARYLQQQLLISPMSNIPDMPQAIKDQIAAMTISQKNMMQIAQELEDMRKAADANGGNEPAKKALQVEMNRLDREAQSRAILRAMYSPQQLQEQMCWFWFNHFNVFQGKANIRAMLGDYEEHAIRPYALGHFRDLLVATSHHPAMLRYLDNEQNAVNHPNENYAREIMELHSMGVDGGYTQRDVQELARILTGVGFNFKNEGQPRGQMQSAYVRQGAFEFNPRRHDYGDKQFLGHTIHGQGLAELDQAIDLLAKSPATAHFISKKLALFFVGENPSPELINTMANAYLSNDGDIKAVLSTMFASPEFINSLGKQFKDPQHYVVSALRLAYDDKPILNTQPVINWLSRLGQPRYGKLTPDGYPLTATAWDSPGQMTTRFEIAKAIGTGNAGLFRTESGNDMPGFPQLSNVLYFTYLQSLLGKNTLNSLSQATSQQEWNTLLLASPEMMVR